MGIPTDQQYHTIMDVMGKLDDSRADHWEYCAHKLLEVPQHKKHTIDVIAQGISQLGRLDQANVEGRAFDALCWIWPKLMAQHEPSDERSLAKAFAKIKPKFAHVQARALQRLHLMAVANPSENISHNSVVFLIKIAQQWGGNHLKQEFAESIVEKTISQAIQEPQTINSLVKLFGSVKKDALFYIKDIGQPWIGVWLDVTNDIAWKATPEHKQKIKNNAIEVLATLLDLGANIDEKNSEGHTTLEQLGMRYYSELEIDRDLLGELVSRGADWQLLLDDMVAQDTLKHPVVVAARMRDELNEVARKGGQTNKPRKSKPAM